MPRTPPLITAAAFDSFGALLRYLRRRVGLTQRELGIAVGYSESQICRLEQNNREPDPTAIAALFVPALQLEPEPEWSRRLLQLAVDGKAHDPIAHIAIGESIPAVPPYAVERARLLERLRARLSIERHLALCGMAGVGKTTLMATLAREHNALAPVCWITFTQGVNTGVDAFVHRLAAFAWAQGGASVAALLQSTPAPLPLDRHLALIGAALSGTPLLCLDNAHLIQHDESMLHVLRHLSVATSLRLLLTSREDMPLPEIGEMHIAGLERAEGRNLVARLTQSPIFHLQTLVSKHQDYTERLLDKTGGNPMLLRLALGRLDDAQVDPIAFVTTLERQPQVAAYLMQVVQQRLSSAAWEWLALASVFREPINLRDEELIQLLVRNKHILSTVTQADAHAACSELQRCHVIDDPRHVDLHPLVRDFVYETLSINAAQRRNLHRLVARWYQRTSKNALETAHHFAQGGELERALDVLAEQEKELIARGQALSAAAILDGMLTALRRRGATDLLRRLLTTRGYLLTGTHRAAEAESDLREALTLATTPAIRAHMAIRLQNVLTQRGNPEERLALIRESLAALAQTDYWLRAQLSRAESVVLRHLTRYDQGLAAAQRALLLADKAAQIMPLEVVAEVRAAAHYDVGSHYHVRDQAEAALDHWRKAIVEAQRAHLPRIANSARGNIGGVLFEQGDIEGSLHIRLEAIQGALDTGDIYTAGYYATHVSDNYFMRGELSKSIEKLLQAREWLAQVGDQYGMAIADTQRAIALLTQGHFEEGRVLIERVIAEREHAPRTRFHTRHQLTRVMLLMASGQARNAKSSIEQVMRDPILDSDPSLRDDATGVWSLMLLSTGDVSGARDVLDESRLISQDAWCAIDRQLIDAAVSIAEGRIDAARLRQIETRCRALGNLLFEARARRLAAAISSPPALADYPRLLWVDG